MASGVRIELTAIDCPNPRELAGFYARLLGWQTIKGREDFLALYDDDGVARLGFQRVQDYQPPTWPTGERPQMLHLDLRVDDLDAEHERTLACGAVVLGEVQGTSKEGWRVYADPAGHPFCLIAD
ncbi:MULTISPECIES: VOC family protein [unclassified Crossiella]|uniref:VOC family protein n=1 Tax=unclassified Crossiella TaxID=2620835 RepID=UPI001FFE3E0B|nr:MULTISPECIES: VOC family protein [unclassified Crossiella]MCK2236662.1 VOC family protein [Crossiella sp. S99.2]MCK2250330.1 VOC family protein [Crossiella sp. S99.1]